jgi:Lyzozyme M1 (1,4-beta-N-acetylmuramidase)
MAQYGLDLSTHNGSVDFNAVKAAGNSFVILRAGYGSSISQKDGRFEEYYRKAKAAGLKVGAYWYSYALNVAQAVEEAKTCLEAIKGKTFEYPIFFDMEDADAYKKKHGMPSNATLAKMCDAFCEYLEKKGYYAGVYASESWLDNQLKSMNKSYDRWVANWGSNNGSLQSDKSSKYRLHQFTSVYYLGGKRFDRNVAYIDYPAIIKSAGLNGLSKGEASTKPADKPQESVPTGSTLDLVVNTMLDTYGKGEARKKALGARYDEVQDVINHIAVADVNTLVKEVWADKYGTGKTRKIVLGDRYDEVMAVINKSNGPKMREGAKVKYSGYLYADSDGNGRGMRVSGTYTVTIYNSNKYGAHLDGLGWVKPGDCTVIG